MTSGNQTLSSIERAILDLRSEENRLAALLQSSTGEALRERASRADNFKALAAFELDALTRQKVVDELDSVERRALQLLEQRNQRLANLAARRARATEEATGAHTAHATSAASMAAAADAIEELTDKVQSSIKANPEWLALEQQCVQAEAIAKGAEEKTARAEQDRESKRKPYENDRLFMYLWRSGYGTSTYRAGPLRRYIDGKIARLVGFDSARVNYYMLTEIPLRLREHANRLREESKKQIVARTAVERRVLETGGIVSLENALRRQRRRCKRRRRGWIARMRNSVLLIKSTAAAANKIRNTSRQLSC